MNIKRLVAENGFIHSNNDWIKKNCQFYFSKNNWTPQVFLILKIILAQNIICLFLFNPWTWNIESKNVWFCGIWLMNKVIYVYVLTFGFVISDAIGFLPSHKASRSDYGSKIFLHYPFHTPNKHHNLICHLGVRSKMGN